ncbi:MAG: pyridoxamine 5'-phosphate oxidase family protein [Acidobacteriaceae bacterium]
MFSEPSIWHEGELEVQKRAGVASKAERLQGMVRQFLPPSAQHFLLERQFAVLSSVDSRGRVWASVVSGQPGFLQSSDPRTIEIAGGWAAADPALKNVAQNHDLGMLVIDFATRRRMRANGPAEFDKDGVLRMKIEQAFSNCPRYIQARLPEGRLPAGEPKQERADSLSEMQRQWIAAADTFFIATAHPSGGVDASHKGGNPGFIHVQGDRVLIIPDYNGNSIFNTLGNIHVNPRAGLVFVNFEAGRTLQLTGRITIHWERPDAQTFPGAERLLEFEVEETLETENALSVRFRLESCSPHNPRLSK